MIDIENVDPALTATGLPRYYVVKTYQPSDASAAPVTQVYVYPTPSVSTPLRIRWIQEHPALSSGKYTPFPKEFDILYKLGAMANFYGSRGDSRKADAEVDFNNALLIATNRHDSLSPSTTVMGGGADRSGQIGVRFPPNFPRN